MPILKKFLLLLPLCALAACSSWQGEEQEPPLPGKRISLTELSKQLESKDNATAETFSTPQQWQNSFWPQAGGYPNHAMQSLALSENTMKKVWSTDIGDGSGKRVSLTAQPIIVDGIIYAMDSRSNLTAYMAESGKRLWSKDLRKGQNGRYISGGLGYGEGYLYVTPGDNRLLALDPKTGEAAWGIETDSPVRAAPTILDGRVFVINLENRLTAYDALDGSKLWHHQGLPETSGIIGGISPAANNQIVVPAYSSGEVYGLRVENGAVAWVQNLTGIRNAVGLSQISDINALPVIDKGMIFAVNYNGRMIAIDERSGGIVWERDISSAETPWVAGNYIFVTTTENEIVALSRNNGAVAWVTQLRQYKDEDDRAFPITWSAPVMGGGLIHSFNALGEAVSLDPATGEAVREWKTGYDVKLPPLVANSTLYILSDNGTLAAYK